jgi:hypothetical protein
MKRLQKRSTYEELDKAANAVPEAYVQDALQNNASNYKISQADKSVKGKFSQDKAHRKTIPSGSVQGQQEEGKYSVCKASLFYLVWTAGYYASY